MTISPGTTTWSALRLSFEASAEASDGRREQSKAAVAEHDDDEGQSAETERAYDATARRYAAPFDGEVAQVGAGWLDDGFSRRPRYSPSPITVEHPLARGEHLNLDVLIELGALESVDDNRHKPASIAALQRDCRSPGTSQGRAPRTNVPVYSRS